MEITPESIQEQIPYYLTQEAKENLIKALAKFPKLKDYYINRYQEEILQGDGWNSLEIIKFRGGERKFIKGILLSNSCDIDPNNSRDYVPNITFSPIIKLDRYIELLRNAGLDESKILGKIKSIKEQKVTTLFYLPQGAGLDEDYIARLDEVYTVPFPSFNEQDGRQKLFTLNQVGFYLFLFKLSVHFCRFHENIPRETP
jgi:hypothetical protein